MSSSHLPPKNLVLASQSQIRFQILQNAGVSVVAHPARIDEASIKAAMLADGHKPRDVCDALAELKAQKLSPKFPENLVLGADQVLVSEGQIFDKPENLDQARDQLLRLRNNTHELLSSAVIFANNSVVFRHIGRAKLTVRNFSDKFIDEYMAQQGDALLETVGAYKIEEAGVQIFSKIDGDHFSILGLPLLEVLDYLRTRGLLTS